MRHSVTSSLTAIFLGVATLPAYAQETDAPQQSAILADAICDAAKDHKYILIGDTNHGSNEIRDTFFNETVISQIADCLPTNAFVFEQPPSELATIEAEFILRDDMIASLEKNRAELIELEAEYAEVLASPTRQQEMNDRIASTQLSSLYADFNEYFQSQIKSTTRIIRLSEHLLERTSPIVAQMDIMRSNNFTFGFYDPGYDLTPADADVIYMLQDAYTGDKECLNINLLFSFAAGSDQPATDFNRLLELLRGRDDDNLGIAASVMQNHPNGAIIFYGAGHMNGQNDLDELLGYPDSFWIDI